MVVSVPSTIQLNKRNFWPTCNKCTQTQELLGIRVQCSPSTLSILPSLSRWHLDHTCWVPVRQKNKLRCRTRSTQWMVRTETEFWIQFHKSIHHVGKEPSSTVHQKGSGTTWMLHPKGRCRWLTWYESRHDGELLGLGGEKAKSCTVWPWHQGIPM